MIPLPEGVAVVPPDDVASARLDAVVELAGGIEGPLAWSRTALAAGTPYVTANKALLANYGDELAGLARQHHAALLASASVGGGVPMLETVHHLAATRAISRLRGVLNATTTYILSAMGDGKTYDEALRQAQTAGYAEADPSLDVDGRDAAQKLAILASEAWGEWRSESKVDRRGIQGMNVAQGQVIRLVADATGDRLTVAPLEVEPGDPLASISGVENLLEVEMPGGAIFRVSGPGAGGRVTAGAVYADLARLVRGERPILFGGSA